MSEKDADCASDSKFSRARKWLQHNITIEPTILLFNTGYKIVYGASINTDMLIWKVCTDELGYNDTVCEDLSTDDQWEDAETEVQRVVNDVQLVQGYIDTIMSLFFVFFTGAMSDKFGRKPLILFSMIGFVLATISQIINYAFLEVLPVEFFYLESLTGVLGGWAVYYSGVYGYGASFADDPNDRAHIIARFDGAEAVARGIGTWLSPIIFDAWGYYGSYGARLFFTLLAMLHVVIFPKEPYQPEIEKEEKTKKRNWLQNVAHVIYDNVVIGTRDTMKTIFMPRPYRMRFLLVIQFIQYAISIFYWYHSLTIYLYMIKVFDADGKDYSDMTLILNILNAIALFFIVPLFSLKLKLHESLIMAIIAFTGAIGYFSMAYANTLLGFYFAYWFTFLIPCQYGPGRALISKSVFPDEIGKILSGNGIISAAVPFGAEPAYRGLYDCTLDTYPSAFLLMTGGATALCFFLNVFIFTQKKWYEKKEEAEEKEQEALDVKSIRTNEDS